MARFAEWLVLESFLEGLEREIITERAVLDTLGMIMSALRENQDEEEEDDGPAILDEPVEKDPELDRMLQKASPEQKGSDRVPGGFVDTDDNLKELEKIRSALKTIRAGAAGARAAKVKELAELLKKTAASTEDFFAPRANPMDAIPTLAELGYFGRLDREGENEEIREIRYNLSDEPVEKIKAKRGGKLTDSDRERIINNRKDSGQKLMNTIRAAASEEGNDPPKEGFPEESEVRQATQDFMTSLNSLMSGRFRSLASRNQSKKGLGKGREGHQEYEADDLANDMALGLIRHFRTRRWKGSGEGRTLEPWSSNDDILESDPRGLVAHLMTTAKNQTKKIKAKASPPPKFSVPNGAAKASLIRSDLDNKDFGFYLTYLRAADESPLRSRNPEDKIVSPGDKRDRMRLSIMQDIEKEVVHNNTPGMSLDPVDIKGTLETYLGTKLVPSYRQVLHASTLAGDDDSSEDEVLSGMDHSLDSDDAFDPGVHDPMDSHARPDDDEAEYSPRLHAQSRASNAILDVFKKVVEELSASGGTGPSKAFALCVKYGLKCHITTKPWKKMKDGNATTTVASVRVSDDATLNIPQSMNWQSAGSNCTQELRKIGLSYAAVSNGWGMIPGTGQKSGLTPISLQLVGEYLQGDPRTGSPGALAALCNKFKSMGLRG